MIEIAVLGFGTVGSGVVELIDNNQEWIRRSVPEGIHVKYILDIREFPNSPYADRVVHDIDLITGDPEVKIVCETMGGKEPAFTFSRKALESGKSVCTSNKELVEALGTELMLTAKQNGMSYLFEASVGGGIPILRPLRNSLVQEEITTIGGILNGTTNYILTKMEQEGAAFDDVLKIAQERGYAERNPEADVEGYDCGRKIAILASLATGRKADYDEIPCEGITKIAAPDFAYAKAIGRAVKLLGIARKLGDGSWSVRTAPFLVPKEHPLYPVSGVFNAVFVHGTMVDDLMFYGRGAGKNPTASAVVSDVVELAMHIGVPLRSAWNEEKLTLANSDLECHRFYIRAAAEQAPALQAAFSSLEQIDLGGQGGPETAAFVTDEISERTFAQCLGEIEVQNVIRLL